MNNNPISNVDPNGDNPLAIGALVGFLSNGIGNLASGQNFFKGWAQASFFGALGGGISAGIGGATSQLNGLAKAGIQAGAHALSGGLLSAAQGGNFGSGALSGALSSGIGSGIGASGLNGSALGWAQWGGGGLGGGLGSVIGGGNFFDGARQGLITGGLNHFAHSLSSPNDIIILIDDSGANGAGHIAELIGNENDGWTLVSKDGLSSGNHITGGKSASTIATYSSLTEFYSSPEAAQYNSSSSRFKTSVAQDKAAISAATKAAKSPYHVLFSNCKHTCAAGFRAANLNINFSTGGYTGPSTWLSTQTLPKYWARSLRIK